MSFDKDTRNLLARTVTACRRRLTEDVTDQLTGVFGLHPDGTVLALKEMSHLTPDQTAAAGRLRELLDHYTTAAAGGEKDRRKSAYERMALEMSFTILNRLAALRLCEERRLVVECVRKGTASDGFRLFEQVSGGALGGRYDTYRVFLECLFDEIALDLGVLFDRTTPQSSVFPSERCMEDVLDELNKPELSSLWTEDETIGWVYQYFNPPEERRAMRDASAAPRNSRELAVRNQFFTPRYVVEFLTDNTLGRIWYEMRKGDTALMDECRYLVRRPNEIFLAFGEKAPPEAEPRTDLSQEELLRQPVYIEHRPKKDPRDLRILDPACGSGHFLLYAFDLLERIYEEAWENFESPKFEATGRTLLEDFETLDDLRREVPKLIIEHNLHGIDIDPRAVQIAALALWLRAQKTWKKLGIKSAERPRVARSNIVTAEPMPGEEDMKEEFTASLKPRVIGQLVDVVFNKTQLAGEAGSLLKIEEAIKDVVSEAKEQWLQGPKPEQQLLYPGMGDQKPKQQALQFDFKGVTDERFWDQAEDRILNALKQYSEDAENGREVIRRLFADDVAQGFAFIDLCRKRYNVVLMNPPFGESSKKTFKYIAENYPFWNKNILCAFFERAKELTYERGAVGSIYDRTILVKSTYEDFRRSTLLSDLNISCLADLGWEVLDANVEVSSTVFCRKLRGTNLFFDIRGVNKNIKGKELFDKIEGTSKKDVWCANPADFSNLPNAVIGYDFKPYMLRKFKNEESIKQRGLQAFTGSQLPKDQYFRLWWEPSLKAPKAFERNIFKGGSFSSYVCSLRDVFIAGVTFSELPTGSSTKIYNLHLYGKPGVAWGERGDWLCAYVLPNECCFALEGPTIPIPNETERLALLGFLNTPLARETINRICGQHKTSGYVNLLPYTPFSNAENVADEVRSAVCALTMPRRLDETQLWFTGFRTGPSIRKVSESIYNEISMAMRASSLTQKFLHEKCVQNYSLSKAEIVELEDLIASLPQESLPIEDADYDRRCIWLASHSCISWVIGNALGRWDIRFALDSSLSLNLFNPFDPLPKVPSSMLVGTDGLPAESGGIVSEEWLHTRPDANTLPPEGTVKKPTIPASEYPLRISWDGILVDDPGFNGTHPHREDIVRRVREVLDLLWKDKAHEIEQEACDILGVSDLRDYFRKPAKFFQDHLKRYSKSRRKAPIYWPLSTASGSYTIWIYYHRLTDQTLYTMVNKYVEPKISEVERGFARVEDELTVASGTEATRLRDRLNEAQTFLGELRDLRGELLRVAALPYKPDLNDGVIINAAPLNSLFNLRSWANDTKKVWDKLKKGEYDWANLAYTIWPDRVREVCKSDRSIAIAHGLEDLCEVDNPRGKKKGGRGRRNKKENS